MKLDVPVSLAGVSIVFISEFRKNIWIVSVFLPHDFYGITDKLRISVKVFPGPEHYMSSINVSELVIASKLHDRKITSGLLEKV
jgi:hypothetical protein